MLDKNTELHYYSALVDLLRLNADTDSFKGLLLELSSTEPELHDKSCP
jgi:hypothetical protein